MGWRDVADGLRVIEGTLDLPGGVRFPVRSAAVRLADGGVWLWSPIAMDDAAAAALDAWGPVRHVVSPCAQHHLGLGQAAARWPAARRWGPATLAARRPELGVDGVLGRDAAPWEDELARVHVEGAPWCDEHVFLHRSSGTLLVADLVFHVTAPETLATRLVFLLNGAGTSFAQSRVWRWVTKDRAAAGRAVRELLRWPILRVLPAHGELVERDAQARLSAALAWMAAG